MFKTLALGLDNEQKLDVPHKTVSESCKGLRKTLGEDLKDTANFVSGKKRVRKSWTGGSVRRHDR